MPSGGGIHSIRFHHSCAPELATTNRAVPVLLKPTVDLSLDDPLLSGCQQGLALILRLLGLDLPVPDHTTFSRRSANLTVAKAVRTASRPVSVVIDPRA
ncbi:hypothetical protein MicloDRAFT_00070000 [Microvirga lotononidis]|uniref:Transposase DDE domain-containing protein n=1 Tax=Microvirga lotononidis TaxID=864069 RepID=I4YK55_9HYPH|nr:hypothetical protein MicloDRAFT_00070000 [Microvirga lotononidis]